MRDVTTATATFHTEGMRRRRVAGEKEDLQYDVTSDTPRKTTSNNTNNRGSDFMAAAKTSRNVNKGFNGSKSKHLGIYAKTVVRVFILLGIYVSYHMIFQRKVPNTILGDGPVPRPRDWHLWGFYNFEDRLNCSGYLNDRTKPVPDMEYWESMLDAYNQVVDPAYKFDDEVPPTEGYRLNEDGLPPYYAKLSPGKGRGLFASRDIQKGEIVHDGTKSDVVFPNETSWKRFMFALPRKIACDQSEWTFTQQLEEDGPMRIVSSLNIAILMNQGNTLRDVNVQPEDGNGKPSEYSSLFRAMKDIKIDEEILMNYGAYDTDFAAAGLAELVLSNISCKSFETCSITEIWYLVKRAFLLGRQDPWFITKFIGSYLICWAGLCYSYILLSGYFHDQLGQVY